jgi:hypothetical protein
LRSLAQWLLSELFTYPKKSPPDSAWIVTVVGVSDAPIALAASRPVIEIAAAAISSLNLISFTSPRISGALIDDEGRIQPIERSI